MPLYFATRPEKNSTALSRGEARRSGDRERALSSPSATEETKMSWPAAHLLRNASPILPETFRVPHRALGTNTLSSGARRLLHPGGATLSHSVCIPARRLVYISC